MPDSYLSRLFSVAARYYMLNERGVGAGNEKQIRQEMLDTLMDAQIIPVQAQIPQAQTQCPDHRV